MTERDKVKCAQLDMLKELKRICDKNKIPYFLVGGTLIGAIRHEGFIPWDDDIDVGMLRENYIRFVAACKTDLSQEYSLYDWSIDPKSPIPFLKMKIKGTHYREELSKSTEMNDEIYIDIFPYDHAPESPIKRKMQAMRNILFKKAILLRCGFTIDEGGKIKKVLYIPLRAYSHIHSVKTWKKKYERNATQYNQAETTHVVSLGGSYSYQKELKDITFLKDLILHRFEDVDLSVPAKYDLFLKEVYGDYLKLPPEEQRISRHGISLIDLGSYQVKSEMGRRKENG